MEILDHRAQEDPRDWVDHQANQEGGVVLELMEPEVCLESQDPRETVASMGCLVCLATRVTGETQEDWVLKDHLGRTERGETMEMLDPEDSKVNQGLVDCWGLKVLMVSLDLPACVEMMVLMVLKETWVPKESQDPQVSREPQELRECQDHRDPMALQERRVLQGSQVYQGCPELMDPRVIQEKRDLLAPRVTWGQTAPRGLSAILALVE